MKHLEFKCPRCGHKLLDEVSTGVVAYNEVDIFPDGNVEYGEEEIVHEATRIHYACRRCAYRLEEATDAKSLVEWINFTCTFSIETIREKLGITEQQARSVRSILLNLEPLQYEGGSISTAHRYLADAGLTHAPALSDPHAAIRAISIEVDAPCYARWLWYVAALNPKETLAYHRREEYYFWTTEEELTQLEEQWKKKNNS